MCLEAKLSLDSIYKKLFLNIFWRGGGGVNIFYHYILTPPTQTLFEQSTLILCQQRPVNGQNDKAMLSLDSALKLSFLDIIEGGGGVNILNHNILTPPHPIKKKVQPRNSIVCEMYIFCVLKLNCHWIPCTNAVLKYFLQGGGGGGQYIIP